MAVQEFARNTKISNKQPQIRNTLLTFSAAFTGVVIGAVAAFAVIMPMVRSEFAAQSRQLSQKLVSMVPASTTLSSCVQPGTGLGSTTSGGSGGQVLGASTVMPPAGQNNQQGSGSGTSFVSKLVSGVFATTTGTISDTGPGSKNVIATTNTNTTTVTNNNDVKVINSNEQSASSGNATVNDNTNAGGATSGNTANTNSSSTTVNINN
jgi:hypothetical protein